MQNPLVSILIPFKNTAKFLPECLDSICSQTYKHWELIIVDDDSKDHSFSIVNSYAKKDSRIQLFKNNNPGIIGALRLALEKSKGKFITRMDSDDIMFPHKLEVLTKLLLEYGPKHVAIGLVKYFRKDGIKEGYLNYQKWLNRLTLKGENYSELYKECVIPSPCWMISKNDLIACNAFNSNRYPEDYDLAFRFYKHHYTCIPCNETIHHWRDYKTRTSRVSNHYADNHFIDLKLHYFLRLHYNSNRPLVIWGAGKKGKYIAKKLTEQLIPFEWICDNPKKIGKQIYNTTLQSVAYLESLKDPQSIISVANQEAQKMITSYFIKNNMESMRDYFFFC